MGGWKEATRRSLVGPEVKLKATGDVCWIKPKKLPTEASDEIGQLQRDFYNKPGNKESIKGLQEIRERLEADGKTLDDADPMELIHLTPQMDKDHRTRMHRLALRYGIGAHNFTTDNGTAIGAGLAFDDETVEEVLEWGPLAEEIFAAVAEYNRPLPKRSDGSSAT